MQTGWGYTDSNTMASCISKHELEGVGMGGGVPCNETDLVYLGNYVKFTATSSDKARFVTIVFVNGILLALTFEVNRT